MRFEPNSNATEEWFVIVMSLWQFISWFGISNHVEMTMETSLISFAFARFDR